MWYQYKSEGILYPIFNDVTKLSVQGRDLPILRVMNYFTMLDYSNETESSDTPFDMMKHGETVDMITKNMGGDGGLYVE